MGLTESREHWSEHGIGEVWRSGDAQPPTRMPPCFVEFIRRVLEQLERPPDTLPVQESILRGSHEPRAPAEQGDAEGGFQARESPAHRAPGLSEEPGGGGERAGVHDQAEGTKGPPVP